MGNLVLRNRFRFITQSGTISKMYKRAEEINMSAPSYQMIYQIMSTPLIIYNVTVIRDK